MSFGFGVGDFLTATQLSFDVIKQIREARTDDAVVVFSFRALQAQRIDEMQEELLELSSAKLEISQARNNLDLQGIDERMERIGLRDTTSLRDLNYAIDGALKRYGQ